MEHRKRVLGVIVAATLLLTLGTAAAAGRVAKQPRFKPVVTSSADEAAAKHLDARLRAKAAEGGKKPVPVLVALQRKTPVPSTLTRAIPFKLHATSDIVMYAGLVQPDLLTKLATSRGVVFVADNGKRTPPRRPDDGGPTANKTAPSAATKAARAKALSSGRDSFAFAAQFDAAGNLKPAAARALAAQREAAAASGVKPTSYFDVGPGHDSAAAWAKGHTGKGVLVGVADSGVDFAHPDLQSTYATVTSGAYAGWPMAFDPTSIFSYAIDRIFDEPGFLENASWLSTTTDEVTTGGNNQFTWDGRFPLGYHTTGDSKSNPKRYHVGYLHDLNLQRYWHIGERAAILVSDANTAGVWDTVRVDLDNDGDFADEKPCTKSSPISYLDQWNGLTNSPGQDGYADVSGGMVYWIADGVNHPPGFALFYSGVKNAITNQPPGVYGKGDLVAFMGSLDDSVAEGNEHGTLCASGVAARGLIDGHSNLDEYPSFRTPAGGGSGMVQGGGREAKVVGIGNIYPLFDLARLQAYDYAAYGLDGVKNTGDELQVLSNSYGDSEVDNDEWDFPSRYVTLLNKNDARTTAFLFSTGNGGPGYGTKVAPAPSTAIEVGASTQFGACGGFDSIDTTAQVTYGDVIPFSNRGPTAMGHLSPHVVADGAFSSGDDPLNISPAFFGDGWSSWEIWGGTSRSAPVAAGNLACVYQAFKDTNGRWPTYAEARTLLMSGANDVSNDPLVQGAGSVNAERSADLAANTSGLLVGSDAWYPGSVGGLKAEAFASVMATGSSDTTSVPITNVAGSPLSGNVDGRVYQRVGGSSMVVTLTPSEESAYNFNRPDWITRIDPVIPAGTELMVVRVAIPFTEFNPQGNYGGPGGEGDPDVTSTVNAVRLLAYDWTDRNSDGKLWTDVNANGFVNATTNNQFTEIEQNEYERFTYGYGLANTTEIRVADPLGRKHDGIFLGLQHRYRNNQPIMDVHVRLEVSYWKRAPWGWLETPAAFNLPAGPGATGSVPMTLSVPATATPGTYQGQVDFSWGGTPSQRVVFPVIVSVAGNGTKMTFGDAGSPAASEPLMPTGRVFGDQDWGWRAESGDWRFFFSDVPTSAGGSWLLVRTQWDAVPTDLDTLLYGPTPSALGTSNVPALFGGYDLGLMGGSVNTNQVERIVDGAGGIWNFQTATGGPAEFVSGELTPGLNEVMIHDVGYAGASIGTTFTGQTGRLQAVPTPLSVLDTSTAGTPTVDVNAELDLGAFSATAFGLTQPLDVTAPVPATDNVTLHEVVTMANPAWIDATVYSVKGTDIDLFLERRVGASSWEQIAGSESSGGTETVRVTTPGSGTYRVVVYTYGPVVGGSDTYKLHVSRPWGTGLSLSGVPGSVSADTTYAIGAHWEKTRTTLAQRNDWEGALFLGPSIAPAAIQTTVTIGYPFTLDRLDYDKGPDGVSRATKFKLQLSKQLDQTTINSTNIRLLRGATPTATTITDAEADTATSAVITVTPKVQLHPATAYTFSVSGLKDRGGRSLPATTVAFTTPPLTIQRLFGAKRYETSVSISRDAFPGGAETVVVATGLKYADALSASALCGVADAPLLLTDPLSVPASVTAEIDRLNATHAIVVGGTGAVSAAAYQQIASAVTSNSPSADTTRIAGKDRYETAVKIAAEVKARGGNTNHAAFIARGDNFPDALAASPLAFETTTPILLTDPKTLTPVTDTAIDDLGIKRFYVLGSPSAVSNSVYYALTRGGLIEKLRIQGVDRYETATKVAAFGQQRGWATPGTVGVALGTNFPDALGGGVGCGRAGGVLVLTASSPLTPVTKSYIAARAADVRYLDVFGGTSTIAPSTYNEIAALFP